MDDFTISRLDSLLRQAQLLLSESDQTSPSPQFQERYQAICELTLTNQFPQAFWHEPILSQLTWLFREIPPNEKLYGSNIEQIKSQQQKVGLVNDFFFLILNRTARPEEVVTKLTELISPDSTLLQRLIASGRLQDIRESNEKPSEKISSFLEYLENDLGINLAKLESVVGCLEALKSKEGIGRANALLVRPGQNTALVIPLELQLQRGDGKTSCTVPSSEVFQKAIERAQKALQNGGFISPSQDVVYCLDLTDSQYTGSSLGLAAVTCMFGAACKIIFDPFTAFTGDVRLEQGEWKIKGVEGIPQKLTAAQRCGCRRVFIPKENLEEVKICDWEGLEIIEVGNIVEFLFQLNTSLQPLSENSIQARKVNGLLAHCQVSGWAIDEPRIIQNGIQFHIAPLNKPELAVTIYNTGTHVPKEHEDAAYRTLLVELAGFDQTGVSIRSVNRTYNINDTTLREKIRLGLKQLQPREEVNEQYFKYF
ncbi:MAG: S16 family serine protease [Nitrospirales bacterium]